MWIIVVNVVPVRTAIKLIILIVVEIVTLGTGIKLIKVIVVDNSCKCRTSRHYN